MTKLYRMKPLEWVPNGGMRLVCPQRFYIDIWSTDCELYQHQDGGAVSIDMYATVDEAKAHAKKLAQEEALRWVEEVTPEAPRWIPVSEAMPPDKTPILAATSGGQAHEAYREAGAWWCSDWTPKSPDERVTHWTPLPQPPKGGA